MSEEKGVEGRVSEGEGGVEGREGRGKSRGKRGCEVRKEGEGSWWGRRKGGDE